MCGACRRGCGLLAVARGEQPEAAPGGLVVLPEQQLLTQVGVVLQELLLLLEQGGNALFELGFKQGWELVKQGFHGRDPLTGLGQCLALRLQPGIPIHLPGPYSQAAGGSIGDPAQGGCCGAQLAAPAASIGAASLVVLGRARGAGMGPSCLTVK